MNLIKYRWDCSLCRARTEITLSENIDVVPSKMLLSSEEREALEKGVCLECLKRN